MKVEYVPTKRHANYAESAHLRITDVMRANTALTRVVLDRKFWGYSYMYAVNQVNLAGGYFGTDEDLTGCAPYGSLVAYFDPDRLPKNQARASLGVRRLHRRPSRGRARGYVGRTSFRTRRHPVRLAPRPDYGLPPLSGGTRGNCPRPITRRHSTIYDPCASQYYDDAPMVVDAIKYGDVAAAIR